MSGEEEELSATQMFMDIKNYVFEEIERIDPEYYDILREYDSVIDTIFYRLIMDQQSGPSRSSRRGRSSRNSDILDFCVVGKGEVLKGDDPLIMDKETCCICLSNYKVREHKRELPKCHHIFHKRCIDRWLRKDDDRRCPICRISCLPD